MTVTSCKPTGADVTIPSGSRCNDGTNALDCTRVPPQTRDTSSPARFALDGEMADGEYWGAVELPYSDQRHHDASGKLYVAVESPGASRPTTTMHVFAKHIRVDANSRELRLYLGHHERRDDIQDARSRRRSRRPLLDHGFAERSEVLLRLG